jgi:p-aminobenzoyl-glutamate transporter AbgT
LIHAEVKLINASRVELFVEAIGRYVAACLSDILLVWIVLFVAWFLLGIPLGPGYPVDVA